jgi:hypothetical protein
MGIAAEMNRGERESACRIMAPSCSAAGEVSGNCMLWLTEPDCGPVVPRPIDPLRRVHDLAAAFDLLLAEHLRDSEQHDQSSRQRGPPLA